MNHEDEIRHYQFLQDVMHLIEDLEHGDRMPESLRAQLHALTCPSDANCCCTLRLPIGEISEANRARIHALTRKVTMSDDAIDELANDWLAATVDVPNAAPDRVELVKRWLLDLRDRYEERGE